MELWQRAGKVAGGVSLGAGLTHCGGRERNVSPGGSPSLFWGRKSSTGHPASFQHLAFCSGFLSCPADIFIVCWARTSYSCTGLPFLSLLSVFQFFFRETCEAGQGVLPSFQALGHYGVTLCRPRRWVKLRLCPALVPRSSWLSSVLCALLRVASPPDPVAGGEDSGLPSFTSIW